MAGGFSRRAARVRGRWSSPLGECLAGGDAEASRQPELFALVSAVLSGGQPMATEVETKRSLRPVSFGRLVVLAFIEVVSHFAGDQATPPAFRSTRQRVNSTVFANYIIARQVGNALGNNVQPSRSG